MGKLLKKELKLTASSITYFFIAFSAMALIPGYPIAVAGFFVCLGIFYSFQSAREYNDITYTALLPVKKGDVVRAKYVFVLGIQGISFFILVVLTLVRMSFLSGAKPYVQNPMMNANLAFLGYILMIFGGFNLVFLMGFFRTAYYIGKPFVLFGIFSFGVIALGETLHHVPGLVSLNGTGFRTIGIQGMILALGVIFYAAGTGASFAVSKKQFEEIDL